jgi:hypothetical protein
MAAFTSESLRHAPEQPRAAWRGPPYPVRRQSDYGRSGSGLLLTGLVLAGLGALAWYYLGPDLVRYMKIRNL